MTTVEPRPDTEAGTEARPWNAITHTCGAWWTGLSRSHCPAASSVVLPLAVGDRDASLAPEWDAHLHQRPVDAGGVTAQLLADLVSAHPAAVQPRRYRPPANVRMFEGVILGGQGAKVFGSVVARNPVHVVNLVLSDDPSVSDAVLIGLDVVVGSKPPAQGHVPVGSDLTTRLVLRDSFTRLEEADSPPVAGLPAGGAEALLGGAGYERSAHGARLRHDLILQVTTLCCRTFSTDSAAERHRKGAYEGGRHCVDPASVGLVPVTKEWGVMWRHPGNDTRFAEGEES